MEQNQNYKLIILTIVISIAIFIVWDIYFLQPLKVEPAYNTSSSTDYSDSESIFSYLIPKSNPNNNNEFKQTTNEVSLLKSNKRVSIINNNIIGSIDLVGAKIDSSILKNYNENINKDSNNIVLLHPRGTTNAYFYESGFISNNPNIDLPNSNTLWKTNYKILTPDKPITLTYINKQGIIFIKTISIDSNYMIKVTDEIINNNNSIVIYPWALLVRHGEPITNDMFISHEGAVGYLNSALEQIKYKDIKKKGLISYNYNNSFVGFADKYFMVSILPNKESTVNLRYFLSKDGSGNYQADYLGKAIALNKKESYINTTNIFVGPKAYQLLHNYGKQYNIPKFEDSIDFGWFYFITKPFLKILLFFYYLIHNFGYAVLCFTILIRLCIFPITYMSFASMAKMKKIQPKLLDLKAQYGKNLQKYNAAIMDLYRKEKVNPLAGCLPLIIQIPILFSIYKVIYISIEMRHATFWWIKDLSAPDPNSIFNLFGLLPYSVPDFLNIGFWAIFMGFTMYIQQKLSGTTIMNQTQKHIMTWFPVIITIVLSRFPVGLIIYWCWSNIISIGQQIVINKIVDKKYNKK